MPFEVALMARESRYSSGPVSRSGCSSGDCAESVRHRGKWRVKKRSTPGRSIYPRMCLLHTMSSWNPAESPGRDRLVILREIRSPAACCTARPHRAAPRPTEGFLGRSAICVARPIICGEIIRRASPSKTDDVPLSRLTLPGITASGEPDGKSGRPK